MPAAIDVASEQALAHMEPVRGQAPDAVVRRLPGDVAVRARQERSGQRVRRPGRDGRHRLTAAARACGRGVCADWNRYLATMFVQGGLDRRRAGSLAALVVSAAEGAVAICRARGAVAPSTRYCEALIRTATPPDGSP